MKYSLESTRYIHAQRHCLGPCATPLAFAPSLSALCSRPSLARLRRCRRTTGTVPQGEEFVLVNPTIVKLSKDTDVMSEVCPP
jgi:hypothetical protein